MIVLPQLNSFLFKTDFSRILSFSFIVGAPYQLYHFVYLLSKKIVWALCQVFSVKTLVLSFCNLFYLYIVWILLIGWRKLARTQSLLLGRLQWEASFITLDEYLHLFLQDPSSNQLIAELEYYQPTLLLCECEAGWS